MKKMKILTMLAFFACAAVLFSCSDGDPSNPTTGPVLSAPTGLTATAVSSSQIDLNWIGARNETGYKVERSDDGTSGWTEVTSLPANTVSYEDTGLMPSATYYYRVCAFNAGGNSGYSNVSGATTLNPSIPAPSAPTGLTAVAVSFTLIELSWTDNADNETGYKVERSADGTLGWIEVASLPASTVSYEDTGLMPSTTYYYRVCAFNAGGNSEYSNVSDATTLTPVAAQPEANCYMVAPGSAAIYIPVSQANRVLTADGLGATMTGLGGVEAGNYTVELVWGDTPVRESGVIKKLEAYSENGKGYILIEPGIAGNAVICIRDNTSGKVKWSWHIWVTEAVTYKKDTETGLTWMDRNLGAKSNTPFVGGSFDQAQWTKTLGLYYQWGRKDAFPASDGTVATQTYYTGSSTTGTTAAPPDGEYTELPDMVQNPLNLATNRYTYLGSLNADYPNDSWGGIMGVKTLYDPCPAGWKVAPYSVNSVYSWGSYTEGSSAEWNFDNFDIDKGAIFNGVDGTSDLGHFYPTSGYRDIGYLNFIGYDSYTWNSAPAAGIGGYALHFNSTHICFVNTAFYRVCGFPVRCVAE